jgi:transcriptional regulator with XRE-family HTH domain
MKIDKEMARRLAEIRKVKGLTQEQFSEPLKIDRATISNLENGNVPLTEKNISLICLAFNVNETWFRTGEGDMFVEAVPGWHELLDTFRKLSPAMRNTVKKIADLLLQEQVS